MKDFNFMGRSEFFNERQPLPLPDNPHQLKRMLTEMYRKGFAKGCHAGAGDVLRYLHENPEKDPDEIMKEAEVSYNEMLECIPSWKDECNQEVYDGFQHTE